MSVPKYKCAMETVQNEGEASKLEKYMEFMSKSMRHSNHLKYNDLKAIKWNVSERLIAVERKQTAMIDSFDSTNIEVTKLKKSVADTQQPISDLTKHVEALEEENQQLLTRIDQERI